MTHVIEPASSARAKCRGCGERIDKGVLRVGERLPNAFGEGEMTLWYHLPCAAYKRPQIFLDAERPPEGIQDAACLEAIAHRGIEHRRLPRVDGIQRAPSARSHCRSCRELIEKDAWRVRLVFYEEGRFEPSGYVHLGCVPAYFETADVLERLVHFSPGLKDKEIGEIRAQLERAPK